MKKFVTVIRTEVLDKTGIAKDPEGIFPLKKITVQSQGFDYIEDEHGRKEKVATPTKETTFTAWLRSPIPNREIPDFGHDLKVGQKILGDIITVETEPYFVPSENGDVEEGGVPGRYVNTATVFVPCDTTNENDVRMNLHRVARQRRFIVKGSGNLGAPGGSIESAERDPRTKMVGHDFRANLPKELRDASPEDITAYSTASSQANQDEASTQG